MDCRGVVQLEDEVRSFEGDLEALPMLLRLISRLVQLVESQKRNKENLVF